MIKFVCYVIIQSIKYGISDFCYTVSKEFKSRMFIFKNKDKIIKASMPNRNDDQVKFMNKWRQDTARKIAEERKKMAEAGIDYDTFKTRGDDANQS